MKDDLQEEFPNYYYFLFLATGVKFNLDDFFTLFTRVITCISSSSVPLSQGLSKKQQVQLRAVVKAFAVPMTTA